MGDSFNWGARFGTDAPGLPSALFGGAFGNGIPLQEDQLRPYNPSPRDMLHHGIAQFFGGGRDGGRAADKVMALIGITPLEAPLTAYDAGRTLGGGLYRSDPGAIARGIGGVGVAGLQVAPLGLLGLFKDVDPMPNAAQSELSIYNPPAKPQRPFEADYVNGAPADGQGRLTQDIEGRPLTARWVVGRKMVGGDDRALPLEEYDALTKEGTGKFAQTVAPSQIGGSAGAVALNRYGVPTDLYLSNQLAADELPNVHAHELSHVVDALAGNISDKGLMRELRDVYNTLNNPKRTPDGAEADPATKPVTPQDFGYEHEDVGREYIVEAIRAYLTNPNYLKTVAPRTAAAIRNAVNANPRLSKIIQFNSVAAPIAAGANDQDDQDQ